MTGEEAKGCLYSQCRVVCGNIVYEKISAIVYRLDYATKNIIVSAELLDKNHNTLVFANLNDINIYEEGKSEKQSKS